jgi:hypothetical protein
MSSETAPTSAPAVSAPVGVPLVQIVAPSSHDVAREIVASLSQLHGDSLRSAFAEALRIFALSAPVKPDFSADKAERKQQMAAFKRADGVFRSAVGVLVRFGEDIGAETKTRHGYSVSASGIINLRRNEVFTLRPAKAGRVSV